MLCVMERMDITVLSVTRRSDQIQARARAVARDAKISLEVTFAAHPEASDGDIWQQARDEVLRYLDLA